jgi:hypothetical protein
VNYLNFVAGQADHALDVVGVVVPRQLEHNDISGFGNAAKKPTVKSRQECARVRTVTVGVLAHVYIVANQQRGDHGARGDVEGMNEKETNQNGEEA